ncbi:WD40 repeat-like protein [Xylariaceae sp. FL0016]|nr:WD40 repeat-like protein [Xylariaceae sp. FL0016]
MNQDSTDDEGADVDLDVDHDVFDTEEGGVSLATHLDIDTLGEQIAPPENPLPDLQAIEAAIAVTVDNAHPLPVWAGQPAPMDAHFVPMAPSPFALHQLQVFDPDLADPFMQNQFLSNLENVTLGPGNFNVHHFLGYWRHVSRGGFLKNFLRSRGINLSLPVPFDIDSVTRSSRSRVLYHDLKGDELDIQGIDWKRMGTTRQAARVFRLLTFQNYTNRPHPDDRSLLLPPAKDDYFRFQSMTPRPDVRLLHFQLRNVLGCTSRTRVFYPSSERATEIIREVDPTTGRTRKAMTFENDHDAQVSTLATGSDILIAGSFYGTYRYRHLDSVDKYYSDGRLTAPNSGITNHVQINTSRHSSSPLAAFASNDSGFRVVDLATNRIISEHMYDFALNCSALSSDKRLRVMVGDHVNTLIADAESGAILQSLEGHSDFGFACDWASDGWTVATGNQDKTIRVWDARFWNSPKAVIRTNIAGARSLRFSPLGSGKRVLVAAEEADYINIIDAQTFATRQTVDVFGELAGISFTDEGQSIMALSSDKPRGGILCLDRCDAGAEDVHDHADPTEYSGTRYNRPDNGFDWLQTPEQTARRPGSQATLTQKRRQAAMSEDWVL